MPWLDASLPPEVRTDLLLAEMTLEEKIDMATGELCLVYGYYNAPIDRLGIPALTMADGPAGIRIPYRRVNGGRATQLPAPIALAATWDVELARIQGDVLGSEALATGDNVLLGPTLDVARTPLGGRNFEGLGEDPLLAARFAVPLIQAIQRHPVLADASTSRSTSSITRSRTPSPPGRRPSTSSRASRTSSAWTTRPTPTRSDARWTWAAT